MFMFFRWLTPFAMCTITLCTSINKSLHAQIPRTGEGYITSSDGVRLYYRMIGSGHDTIVVLHGGPGFDLGYLAPDLEPLAASHVVIFYDQRGSGRSTLVSDSAIVNIGAHITDIEAVRQHFKIHRMLLFGHSWGAMLASRYALRYPDHLFKIILASPGPIRRTPFMQEIIPRVTAWMDSTTLIKLQDLRTARRDTTKDAQLTCRAFWKVYIRGFFADPNDTATVRRMKGDFCTSSTASIRNGFIANALTWASLGEWDWRNDFRNVRIPVLIITGNKDIFSGSMPEWEAAFPNARLVLLEGAAHYPQVERPAQFFNTVAAFLR